MTEIEIVDYISTPKTKKSRTRKIIEYLLIIISVVAFVVGLAIFKIGMAGQEQSGLPQYIGFGLVVVGVFLIYYGIYRYNKERGRA